MHTHLPQSLRSRLSQRWSRQAEAYLLDDAESEVDAIWVPPTCSLATGPAAFLHCQEIQAETQRVRVLAQRQQESTVRTLLLPLDEIVPLSHSSLPPLSLAAVTSADPLFHAPGDGEAFRIRCLARIPPTELISPLRLVEGISGMRLQVEREAIQGNCACSFRWTPEGIVLGVETDPHTGQPTACSVGLALAAWFCSRTPRGSFRLEWERSDDTGLPSDLLRQKIVSTYQALRLPSLVLFMVLRAMKSRRQATGLNLAATLRLPEKLIHDRLAMLRSQGEL